MARRDRDQEKKRRRQKRQQKRQAREGRPRPAELKPPSDLVRALEALKVPAPAHWPGASDPSLARPDLVKLELAEFVFGTEPSRSKGQQLEDDLHDGLLHFLPDLHHWAIEEFLWHGLPGDP